MIHLQTHLSLDGITLSIEQTFTERVIGIFGPSGAGKSSLLRVITGLERRARGRIVFDDQIWQDSAQRIFLPPELRHIGYVPQEGLLFPHLSVRQNILSGARRARQLGTEPPLERVSGLLEVTGLLDRRVQTLSGGERQRVALARALCSGPRLLVLDEPLASLDLSLRRRILPLLRRVREEFQIPMLLVSHDPDEITALCDHVIALQRGQVVAVGGTIEVLSNPAVLAPSPSWMVKTGR